MLGIVVTLFFYKTNYSESIQEITQEDVYVPFIQYVEFSSNHSITITAKEFYNESYIKIETEFIDFEVPRLSTHYWNNSGLDNYEIIIRNVSIKGFQDYIFKVTWDDDRYLNGTVEVHYEFIDGVLNKSKVSLHSIGNKSELNLRNFNIEVGEIIGKEFRLDHNDFCDLDTAGTCEVNISFPVYEWRDFEPIDIGEKISFIAIDPTDVSACGTLSTADLYFLINDITETSVDCILITGSNVDFNGNNFTLIGGVSNDPIDISGTINNVTVRDILIRNGNPAIIVASTVTEGRFININVSRPTFGSSKIGLSMNGFRHHLTNIEVGGLIGGGSASIQLIQSNNVLTNGTLMTGVIGIDFGSNSDNNTVIGMNISRHTVLGVEIAAAPSDNNKLFNNFFNNTLVNVGAGTSSSANYFNTSLQTRTNIIEGANFGGNYWAFPNGTGYSETCTAGATAGICENPVDAGTSLECEGCTGIDVDEHPLTFNAGAGGTANRLTVEDGRFTIEDGRLTIEAFLPIIKSMNSLMKPIT